MNAALANPKPEPRGWCPGALRPMESGDGLIVRLRPRGGSFAPGALCVIADLAASYGNGQIDLTRRANLQLRGLREEDLPALWKALAAAGLLDDNAEAESVRNVMVSPLTGLDPDEILDPRPIVRTLEDRLASDEVLWALPGKFGFSVDGGGDFSIGRERADIRLSPIVRDGSPLIAIGLDRHAGIDWIGVTTPEDAAETALEAARQFLRAGSGFGRRLRELPDESYERLRATFASGLEPLPRQPVTAAPRPNLGLLDDEDGVFALALAAPFGRVDAASLAAIAAAAEDRGVAEIQLSPWRKLYLPLQDPAAGSALAATAADAGFILDANDPLLAIDACTGAPGCGQTALDTHRTARELAPHLKAHGIRSCHISGCAKGCARSRAADLVLVGAGEAVAVRRDATAQAPYRALIPKTRLSRLPDLIDAL